MNSTTAVKYQCARDLAVEFYQRGLILESAIDDQTDKILEWTDEALQQMKKILSTIPRSCHADQSTEEY
jgi:hypothetical protein